MPLLIFLGLLVFLRWHCTVRCMAPNCPWASDYMSVWPLGVLFFPMLEALGKSSCSFTCSNKRLCIQPPFRMLIGMVGLSDLHNKVWRA